jgi:hypothetical protein
VWRLSVWLVRPLPLALLVLGLLHPLAVRAQPPKDDRDVREEAEATQRAMDIFLRGEKVLIRRGEWGLDLTSFYSTDTRDVFVESGAGVGLAKVRTRFVESALIARYGLLNNLELDLRIPFVYGNQEIDSGASRRHTDQAGLGDVSGSLRYQVWHEGAGTPDVILSVEGKSRTGDEPLLGTGHWNAGATIALVKTLDPIVFFGQVGYNVTLERDGRDPGDEVLYQLGIGYSLNDRVSLSTQLIGAVVGDARQDGRTLQRSNLDIISVQLSVTARATRHVFIEPTVTFGISKDAPDVIVGFSVLYRF